MWWKIYFWITIVFIGLALFSLFAPTKQNIPASIFSILTSGLAMVGLYAYAFQKQLLPRRFWQVYFWIYLLLDALYFIYAFLPAFLSKYFLFLIIYPDTTIWDSMINTALDIPLLYALFQVSKGKLYVPKAKKKITKKSRFQWGMLQMALWGYSSVLTFFLFILAFFPSSSSGNAKATIDYSYITSITIMFAPLLIFWLWIIIYYKQYKWTWWRTTLVANAVLYSGSIIFGILSPSSVQSSSGFDIVGVLQLFILLLSLYVFGREQFMSSKKGSNNFLQK